MSSEIKGYIDTASFFSDINGIVEQYQTNPLDAVVHYCQERGIDLDTAELLIRSNSKFK
jgi:hypothetical protein